MWSLKGWIVHLLLVKQVVIHNPPNFKSQILALGLNQSKATCLKWKSERNTVESWRTQSTFLLSILNRIKLSNTSECQKCYCQPYFNWQVLQTWICFRTGLNRVHGIWSFILKTPLNLRKKALFFLRIFILMQQLRNVLNFRTTQVIQMWKVKQA